MPPAPSTRWCPTPEQLMTLEEMYRSGLRTPNAAQIQQITAHLAYYGKIEGKNVFYWFQNHKARDRQKLRRRLSRHQQLLHLHQQQQLLLGTASATNATLVSMAGAASVLPQYQPHSTLMDFPYSLQTISATHIHLPFVAAPVHQQLVSQQGAYQEAVNRATMNLVCKLESCGHEEDAKLERSAAAAMPEVMENKVDVLNDRNHEEPRVRRPTLMTEGTLSSSIATICHQPPCCRPPLKTLDLFPIQNNGGLQARCTAAAASKSSSCSTSITN